MNNDADVAFVWLFFGGAILALVLLVLLGDVMA